VSGRWAARALCAGNRTWEAGLSCLLRARCRGEFDAEEDLRRWIVHGTSTPKNGTTQRVSEGRWGGSAKGGWRDERVSIYLWVQPHTSGGPPPRGVFEAGEGGEGDRKMEGERLCIYLWTWRVQHATVRASIYGRDDVERGREREREKRRQYM